MVRHIDQAVLMGRDPAERPTRPNADDWCLFLETWRGSDPYIAVKICEAIEERDLPASTWIMIVAVLLAVGAIGGDLLKSWIS